MTNVDDQPDKLDSGHVEEEFLPSSPPQKAVCQSWIAVEFGRIAVHRK